MEQISFKLISLRIISLIHILFILFVVLSPISNSNYILMMHLILIPFMVFHWILNDNTCMLTIIERHLRKKIYGDKYKEDECFTCNLIEPVYNFIDDYKVFNKLIYGVTLSLWLLSGIKLYMKYNKGLINDWKDLFKL